MSHPVDLDSLFATPPKPGQGQGASGGLDLDSLFAPAGGPPGPAKSPATPGPPPSAGADSTATPDAGQGQGGGASWDTETPKPSIAARISDWLAGRSGEETRVAQPPVESRTPAQQDQDALAYLRGNLAQPADVTAAPKAAPIAAIAQHKRTIQNIARANAQANFSPDQWRNIAVRGYGLAVQLRQAGHLAEADDIQRKAHNAQLLADNSEVADTPAAIALSNILGIVHDPYAAERRNIEAIQQPGMTFTPEEQQTLLGVDRPAATDRPFDITKDVAIPLIGQGATIAAGGALGRSAALLGGQGLEALGAKSLGEALGKLGTVTDVAEQVGPRIPVKTYALLKQRLGEETDQFIKVLPDLMKQGASEGQIVMGAQQYRAAREQGASIPEALEAATAGALLNVPLGIGAEVGLGAAGRAVGLGYDPVRRLIGAPGRALSDHLDNLTVVSKAELAAREALDRIPTNAPPATREQLADLVQVLGEIKYAKSDADRAAAQEKYTELFGSQPEPAPTAGAPARPTSQPAGPDWWENLPPEQLPRNTAGPEPLGPEAPQIEQPTTFTPRAQPEEPPLRTAAEIAQGQQHPVVQDLLDQADATKQYERAQQEQAALAAQAQAEANSPEARLEQAAAAQPARKQGPLTLGQTIARAGREADTGRVPEAGEYRAAIDKYVDAAARVRDTEHPSTRMQIELTRAKNALNAARLKYGRLAGGAGLIALATSNSDLTDDEKKMVGLAGLALTTHELGGAAFDEPTTSRLLEHVRVASDAAAAGHPMRDVQGNAIASRMTPDQWMQELTSRTPLTEDQATALHQAMVARAPEVSSAGLLNADDVQQLVRQLGPNAPVEPQSAGFTSKLRMAVDALGKKWDQPRPIADWIGKLKGDQSIKAAERNTIMPYLEELAKHKGEKITRDQVRDAIDRYAPNVERATLANTGVAGERTHGPIDAQDYLELDDIPEERGAISDQIALREDRKQELEDEIENEQDRLHTEMTDAEEKVNSEHSWLVDQLVEQGRLGDRDARDALYPAINYLDEHIEGEYIPRGAVDQAMQEVLDSGYIAPPTEPELPPDLTIDSREVRNPETGDRETLYYVKRNGAELAHTAAPTELEAMAKAEQQHGIDLGGSQEILPSRFKVEKRTEDGDEFYVLLDGQGHEEARDADRESLISDYVRDNFEGRYNDDLIADIHRGLDDYARARSDWMQAESEHYYATEDATSRFETEYDEIGTLEQEIEELQSRYENAPEEPPPDPNQLALPGLHTARQPLALTAANPHLMPMVPNVKGKPEFQTYQRIGGGSNYRELLNIQEGLGYRGGHWTSYGHPDTIGHIRVEDHRIPPGGDLTPEQLAHTPDETPAMKDLRDSIAQGERERTNLLKQMDGIARAYDALPEAEHHGPRAQEMARNYQSLAQQVAGHSKVLADNRELLGRHLGRPEGEGEKVAVMLESQSDYAQDATRHGAPPSEGEENRLAGIAQQAHRELERASTAHDQARSEVIGEIVSMWKQAMKDDGKDPQQLGLSDNFMRQSVRDILFNKHEMVQSGLRDLGIDQYPHVVEAFEKGRERLEPLRQEVVRTQAAQIEAQGEWNAAQDARHFAPPPGPFTDTKLAFTLNAARFLIDSAERGYDRIAWSDARNRIDHANLPFGAAKSVYDQITPKAMRSLLGGLGFKDVPIEHTTINGAGHWTIKLTPAMREAIRKVGLPLLSALAIAGTPRQSQAETQAGAAGPSATDLYASTIGGVVAGAALAYLATHKKFKRMVQENRELNRALMMDDLSGLANKRALHRAIPAVDKDPNSVWIVLDGDNFKRINDTLGHPVGDKAITHFGDSIRAALADNQVPERAFRGGGDEFAIAVPREKAAEALASIQVRSKRQFGNVETKLTGAIGDTFAEADHAMNAAKASQRGISRGGFMLYSNPIGPAMKELKRAPTSLTVAALGAVLATQDQNPDLQKTGLPLIGLAALNAIGSRRLWKAKDVLGEKIVNRLRESSAGTSFVQWMNPDALLDRRTLQAIRAYEAMRATGAARAKEFSGLAQSRGPEVDRLISDLRENESWQPTEKMKPEDIEAAFTLAAQIGDEIDRTGRMQVAAGTLSPAAYAAHEGTYLPRKYAMYEALDVNGNRTVGGQPARAARIKSVKARTLDEPVREAQAILDNAKAEGDPAKIKAAQDALDEATAVFQSRRQELGEIRESSYRTAAAIDQAYANVGAAQLFQTIKDIPGVVHPEFKNALDEFLAAKDEYTGASSAGDRAAAKELMDAAFGRMEKIAAPFRTKGGDYVTLPSSKALGVLSGMVVQREVANSLVGMPEVKWTNKLLKFWKQSKTVFNPGTHLANIVSNTTMSHMAGMYMHEQPQWLTAAAKDMKEYGPGTRALTEAGLLQLNFANAGSAGASARGFKSLAGLRELARTTDEQTRKVLAEGHIVPEQGAVRGVKRAIRAAQEAYGSEDDLFRVAMYLKATSKSKNPLAPGLGLESADAVERARNFLGDFRTRSPALRMVRGSLSPFILYPAKVLPKVAQAVIDHPWRYITLISTWAALNEFSKSQVGPIPEEDKNPKDRSPLGYFFPGLTQLPFTDAEGNKAAIDISRYTPFSTITTAAPPGTTAGALGDEVPALAAASGPGPDLAAQFIFNRDPYTGDPLVKRDYPTKENVGHLINAAVNEAAPTALGFYRERLMGDLRNKDWDAFKTDLLGPVGLRPRYIRPGAATENAQFQLQQTLRQMRQDLHTDLRKSHDPTQDQHLIEQYRQRVESAFEHFNERLGRPNK